ncbi:hypothetical protein EMIHUDRAFT_459627 [Emiliania huxleyi CCMP1516]|uniref:Uncharacterized protein n=2 Tax=Emiliania huxleyi TaxID=2903 RepID=A0A0D3INF8_EMIH1|nr:hypothetical protein EMIHUDRAFT_459627 [Emiliania huxleyi CCMP1516]EOD12793.1 hypothetical protein EMIHUDRAFT_459627 [Emiliania huxleyi CCMP1516]|eukprot:XP_005765222.1 hypothetical protein EMIHUDRAFT_459627 [Emiliania huxleyi CCMP1516]
MVTNSTHSTQLADIFFRADKVLSEADLARTNELRRTYRQWRSGSSVEPHADPLQAKLSASTEETRSRAKMRRVKTYGQLGSASGSDTSSTSPPPSEARADTPRSGLWRGRVPASGMLVSVFPSSNESWLYVLMNGEFGVPFEIGVSDKGVIYGKLQFRQKMQQWVLLRVEPREWQSLQLEGDARRAAAHPRGGGAARRQGDRRAAVAQRGGAQGGAQEASKGRGRRPGRRPRRRPRRRGGRRRRRRRAQQLEKAKDRSGDGAVGEPAPPRGRSDGRRRAGGASHGAVELGRRRRGRRHAGRGRRGDAAAAAVGAAAAG